MTKARATTISQRFGFLDGDLKTSKHDEIMEWLDNNMVSIITKLINFCPIWTGNQRVVMQKLPFGQDKKLLDFNVSANEWGKLPLRALKVKKFWEFPIKSKEYIIGFVDMKVEYGISWLDYDGGEDNLLFDKIKVNSPSLNHSLLFEVKTSVPSIGELLRQINMYREYDGSSFVVVAPPNAILSNRLVSQGIAFIAYPNSIWK
jgi:hypothetical protein